MKINTYRIYTLTTSFAGGDNHTTRLFVDYSDAKAFEAIQLERYPTAIIRIGSDNLYGNKRDLTNPLKLEMR